MITPALLGVIASYRRSESALLLNFNDSLVCEATGETFTLAGSAAIETGIFTKCLNVNGTNPGGGGTHRCYSNTVRTEWQLNDGEDFQLECFFSLNGTIGTTVRQLVSIGPDPNQNHKNFTLGVLTPDTNANIQLSAGAPLSASFTSQTTSPKVSYDTAVHHAVMTGVAGILRVALDGQVSLPAAVSYSASEAATLLVRVGGGQALSASNAINAKIDSVRLSRTVSYDLSAGNFTPPSGPLGLSL